jgi:hypothetical protein
MQWDTDSSDVEDDLRLRFHTLQNECPEEDSSMPYVRLWFLDYEEHNDSFQLDCDKFLP